MTRQITRQVTARKLRTTSTAPLKVYVLLPGFRPKSGNRLYAHTAAALEVLGITRTRSAPISRLISLIGHTAFTWHATKLGTLEPVGENVKLSKIGSEVFTARERDGIAPRHLIDAFKMVFITGKPNEEAQVLQHHISQVTA